MTALPRGVFAAHKKNNEEYFRASFTFNGRHISLGSFTDAESAGHCYEEAKELMDNPSIAIGDYSAGNRSIPFDKWVILINLRDNSIYFPTPIYLRPNFFYYYLDETRILKFDKDDLFYYANKKIMARGGHLFVSDFGVQENILSRYGIMSRSQAGRDYIFKNGDRFDFRYSNLSIINKYHGVRRNSGKRAGSFTTRILIGGNLVVGTYSSETEAAIAYNKAADILKRNGVTINYPTNYVESITNKEYAEIYDSIKISPRIINYVP